MEKKFALSVDGGGIRTLLAARFVLQLQAKLREWTGRPDLKLSEFFSCAAGGSTGAIVALAVSADQDIDTIVNFFSNFSAILLDPTSSGFSFTGIIKGLLSYGFRDFSQRMNIALDAALKPRWEGQGLEAALIPIFKDATMASTACRALVPVYEIESRQPTIFTSDDQTRIIDVVAAAFSAPLIFPPRKILRGAEYKHYSDGGLFANNPSMSLVSHMLRQGQIDSLQNLFVSSIGTLLTPAQGRDNHGDSHSLLKFGDMVDGLSSASTLIVDRQTKDMLGDANYVRVSFPLGDEIPFDRADEATIQDLITAEIPDHIWNDLHARLRAFAPDKFP
eukprot:TRINITY_DN5625_c0_g1_i1.p1 TRINITY_DN5625_c0_g1~~TRINITY_DN5625_c0_g1_i1.p1  ORF type:complete len:334 (-),score=55.53 TRINITY_DN5625_c0_g1_i1:137-1138(-)